jgi:glycine oxidase
VKHPILIVGGGIAGLCTAQFLEKQGFSIHLIDCQIIGQGSSRVAAGMLAPVHELEFTETQILKAGLESLQIYKQWESEIKGLIIDRTGTLEIASAAEDIPYLQRQYDFQKRQGLEVYWLESQALQEKEPLISPNIPCGIFAPGDIQIENRPLLKTLKLDLLGKGITLDEHTTLVDWDESRSIAKVVNLEGEEKTIPAAALVLATGVRPVSIAEAPDILPVKGEMIALEKHEGFPLRHIIRIRNRRLGNGYVVPKQHSILVGATSEHMGMDQRNSFGGVMDILRRAWQVLPGLYDLAIQEVYAGFRPAAPNHLPVIQKIGNGRKYAINGLYRHGILLGPWAGREMAQLIQNDLMETPCSG